MGSLRDFGKKPSLISGLFAPITTTLQPVGTRSSSLAASRKPVFLSLKLWIYLKTLIECWAARLNAVQQNVVPKLMMSSPTTRRSPGIGSFLIEFKWFGYRMNRGWKQTPSLLGNSEDFNPNHSRIAHCGSVFAESSIPSRLNGPHSRFPSAEA